MLSTDLMLVTILTWSLSEATTIYKEVLINATTNISCIPNEDIQIQWHHTAPNEAKNYVYAGGHFKNNYRHRGFRLEKDSNTGPYHLVIPHARGEDAGLYECKEDATGSRMFVSTELTVLESRPECGLDMESEGYVGPSTCTLEQDDMTFTCAVSFNGKPPPITWTTLTLNGSQSFNTSTCNIENGRITCSLTIRADSKYDGSIFTCRTTHSSVDCGREIIKVQYFDRHLVSGKRPLVVKNIGDKVNCSVNSNQDIRFNWTRLQNDKHVFITDDQELSIETPGLYQCYVDYHIRNDPCDALVIEVKVRNPISTTCEPPKATALTSGKTAIDVLSIIAYIGIVVISVLVHCF